MSAAALPFVALGLQAGTKILGGIDESKGLKAEARIDEENARLTEFQASIDSTQIRRDERMAAGEMLAGFGESGLLIGSGSPFDLVMQSAFNRDRDIAAVRFQAAGESANLRAQASAKRKAAKRSIINGLFGAAASVISGAGQMSGAGEMSGIAANERTAMLGGGVRLSRRASSMGSGLVDPRRYGKTPDPRVNY